ncbi:hypothetical protein HII36_13485 [Nonomuraea sp. NN258]|uniref:hypothetical protein n=1 Tax=Nonomuraea antri TaxID=2730852 RepID=UPI0015688E66|nr:hypothetical protein [Nonomuraea antri]NRQ32845.1 hypothetical protein [Nonomuraea antri]
MAATDKPTTKTQQYSEQQIDQQAGQDELTQEEAMRRLAELSEMMSQATGEAIPPILPIFRRSGVYLRNPVHHLPVQPGEGAPAEQVVESEQAIPPRIEIEELRVDVDGLAPTMTISGSIFKLFQGRLTWIARVAYQQNTKTYTGAITYRDGPLTLLPHTHIAVKLSSLPFGMRTAQVRFTGGGMPASTRHYTFRDSHFRTVGIEFDCASDASLVTSYPLHSHPNRPVDLPNVTLTVEQVFSRQGIRVINTGGGDQIPISEAMNDAKWSDLEMHDAMQRHWTKWADTAQWQLWTLFAGQHEAGASLGGIMFDDIGTAQRQGCAIFLNSFISDPPPGDPDALAAVHRMRFWTAVHEIGHTFNLAHSWQKSLVHQGNGPWMPLADEKEARSPMNYPFLVNGGPQAFFADFRYLFSENELVFLRHAPARFVQHGNMPWFDHHGFEQARARAGGLLQLSLRLNRASARYEMLEPVTAELKLKNVSAVPVVVDRNILQSDRLGVVVSREGREARQWVPYAASCTAPQPHVLQPGESLYAPLFLSAGRSGWLIDEPGSYLAYAAVRADSGDVLSAPLAVRVSRPDSHQHERAADDLFTDEVGRVLTFGGSRVLTGAMDTLREIAEGQQERAVAKYAAACVARISAVPGRVLEVTDGERRFTVTRAQPDVAERMVSIAYGDMNTAAETLGHIRLTQEVTRVARALVRQGDERRGASLADGLAHTLEQRAVLGSVVAEVRQTVEQARQEDTKKPRL